MSSCDVVDERESCTPIRSSPRSCENDVANPAALIAIVRAQIRREDSLGSKRSCARAARSSWSYRRTCNHHDRRSGSQDARRAPPIGTFSAHSPENGLLLMSTVASAKVPISGLRVTTLMAPPVALRP